jgi:hypothetical protein
VASTGAAIEALSDQPPPKHQPMVPSLPATLSWPRSQAIHEARVSVAAPGSTAFM